MSSEQILGQLVPTGESRMGRMLIGGYLTATMRSKRSGQHITVTFKAKDKAQQYKRVSYADASHIFVTLGDGEFGATKVGTYYPRTGKFYADVAADQAHVYAATRVLKAAHTGEQENDLYEVMEAERCGVCGAKLKDPVSITRGIGPDCLGKLTGSTPYQARQQQVVKVPKQKKQPAAALPYFSGVNERRNMPTFS